MLAAHKSGDPGERSFKDNLATVLALARTSWESGLPLKRNLKSFGPSSRPAVLASLLLRLACEFSRF